MTPLDAISRIRATGGSICVANGKLSVTATPEVMAGVRPALVEHKTILIRLLDTGRETEPEPELRNWWDPELSDRDNRVLDEFFGYSSDPERFAIQWVETLSVISE